MALSGLTSRRQFNWKSFIQWVQCASMALKLVEKQWKSFDLPLVQVGKSNLPLLFWWVSHFTNRETHHTVVGCGREIDHVASLWNHLPTRQNFQIDPLTWKSFCCSFCHCLYSYNLGILNERMLVNLCKAILLIRVPRIKIESQPVLFEASWVSSWCHLWLVNHNFWQQF